MFFSCEKDDICGENTPTTPQLIIEFYNNANPEELKDLSSVLVYGFNDQNEIVAFQNVGINSSTSVKIPLRSDSNITKIGFHKSFDVDNPTSGNLDVINFSYNPNQVYVSRACGFKTVYEELSTNLEVDSDNWVLGTEIVNSIVENENEAHVKIYH